MSTDRTPSAHPVVFDREGRQLFGWYHPPATVASQQRGCVVVMCNPIGYDAICSHRHYRVLAQQLAAAGFAVLRYDHHGTGDSAGSDEDAERITAWLRGVATAVAFGKSLSGAGRASLFGLRMGGTLAIAAAIAQPLVDTLVAWSPFASGAAYLREMRALRVMGAANTATTMLADVGADMGEESAGYLLTTSTIVALGELNLLNPVTAPAPAILLLARDDIPQSEKLARHLVRSGAAVTPMNVAGYAAMMRDTFDSVIPQEALDEIRRWLESRYPLQEATTPLPYVPQRFLAGTRGADSNVQETPLSFGEAGRCFGMLSEPLEAQGQRAQTAVVFVSVGSNHHIGPNRMYVSQARAMASLGFLALRMDIGGVGESPPAPGYRDNQLYALHSIADVQAAVQLLRAQRQVSTIILVGVCSGAYLSFHTALADSSIASMVLINPQTFSWREGDSLELKIRHGIRSMGFYRSRLFSAETWKRIVKGQINLSIIAVGVIAMLRKRAALRLARLYANKALADTRAGQINVKGTFRKLLDGGMHIFMLYSANDGGLNEIETQLGQNAYSLQRNPRFKFQIVDGADHTFTPLWAQRRLLDLLTQHVMRLYG